MTARTARREREGVRGREGPVHGDIMLLGIMRFMLKYSGGEEAAQWESGRGTQIYVGCCNIDAGLPAGQPTYTCKAARASWTNQRLPHFSQFPGPRLASDKSRTARSFDESRVFPRCFFSNPVLSYPVSSCPVLSCPVPSRPVWSHPIRDLFMFGHILRSVTNLYPCHASCRTKSTT